MHYKRIPLIFEDRPRYARHNEVYTRNPETVSNRMPEWATIGADFLKTFLNDLKDTFDKKDFGVPSPQTEEQYEEIDRNQRTNMSRADAYKVLRLSQSATLDEIKKNYKRLMLLYHPDKNPGNKEANARAAQLNVAYDILTKNNQEVNECSVRIAETKCQEDQKGK